MLCMQHCYGHHNVSGKSVNNLWFIDCIVWRYFNPHMIIKVSKGAKIWNRYNKVPHLTRDTNGKVTNSQPDTTNESQEVSPFPAGDHKAHINIRAQRHSMTRQNKNIKDPQKKCRLGTVIKIIYWRA